MPLRYVISWLFFFQIRKCHIFYNNIVHTKCYNRVISSYYIFTDRVSGATFAEDYLMKWN